MTITVDKAASACPVWCNNHFEDLHFHSSKFELGGAQPAFGGAEQLEVSLVGKGEGAPCVDVLTAAPTTDDVLVSVPLPVARLLGEALVEAVDIAESEQADDVIQNHITADGPASCPAWCVEHEVTDPGTNFEVVVHTQFVLGTSFADDLAVAAEKCEGPELPTERSVVLELGRSYTLSADEAIRIGQALLMAAGMVKDA